jgi:hypothetical protein
VRHQVLKHLVDGIRVEQPFIDGRSIDLGGDRTGLIPFDSVPLFLFLLRKVVVADAFADKPERDRHGPGRDQKTITYRLVEAVSVRRHAPLKVKQPIRVTVDLVLGGGLLALAGLWETWRSRSSGERVRSFAIVTTEPNELSAQLHNRMPVVLPPEAWPVWLGEEPADEAQLKSLLVPYPSQGMAHWPVSGRVGNVKNNDPGLVEPIAAIECTADTRSED